MIELAILQNGFTDLPIGRNAEGRPVVTGSVADSLASMQRTMLGQVRQAVLAEQLGFDYWFLTEHHFQPEGAECSPNPLVIEAAIAVQTSRIRLGQMASIAPWHHPLRLAEQAAIVDILSGGRLEFGIGRGYQPREAEVLGRPYGAGIQDQEANRAIFEEMYNVIIRSYTEDSFSYRGEFFNFPPSYTQWHHPATIDYFSRPEAGRALEQVLEVGPKTGAVGMASGATYLREISVGPQPLQKPYPQFWMPITSKRSLEFCARTGMNAIQTSTPTATVRPEMETFYNAAQRYGFPDRLDRGEFAYGWDGEKKRGVATVRIVHLIDKGVGNREASDLGNDLYFHFIAPFALGGDPRDPEKAMAVPKPQDLIDAGICLVGSPQLVIDGIMDLKQAGGYDDMMLMLIFDMHGQPTEVVEEQMQHFAETVMPVLHKEMGRNDNMSPLLTPPPRPVS